MKAKLRVVSIIILAFTSIIMSMFYHYNRIIPMIIINFLLFFAVIIKAKLSLFSLKSLISFYVLIPVLFQHFTGESYGVLQFSKLSLETGKINVIIYIYILVNYLFITNTNVLDHEKRVIKNLENLKGVPVIIFSMLAIILIIVYYPPKILSNGDRFYHLLPGDFWNHLSVIFLIFLLPSLKRNKLVLFPWLFVIAWCFLKKERVDAIGLLFLLLIVMYKKKMVSKNVLIILTFVSVCFLAIMGITRIGDSINSFDELIKTILIQSTSSDIAYILNISIHYVDDYGLQFGQTYFNYFYELLPIGTSSYDASLILNNAYGHPGGIHLLSEPYMNFGFIGVIIYSIFEGLILNWLLKKKNKIVIVYYCFFVVSSFRYCWYGIRYLETGIVYLIPLAYCLYIILKRKKKGYKYVANQDILQNS